MVGRGAVPCGRPLELQGVCTPTFASALCAASIRLQLPAPSCCYSHPLLSLFGIPPPTPFLNAPSLAAVIKERVIPLTAVEIVEGEAMDTS